jgi:uncharacterized membrane protein YdcZ (DUF606 family)
MPGPLTIPATASLGTQLVLLAQLAGMLVTALIFDCRAGKISCSDRARIYGFAAVLIGVAVDNIQTIHGGEGFDAWSAVCFVATFGTGVGYALQAKCNGRLARDLGSTARATCFSAAVSILANIPVLLILRFKLGVPLYFSTDDWALWLSVGMQSAFYIGSLAVLPSLLGYTASYLLLLLGKLASSSLADATGLSGKTIDFGLFRATALVLVFLGAALFSKQGGNAPVSCPSEIDLSFINSDTEVEEGVEDQLTENRQ